MKDFNVVNFICNNKLIIKVDQLFNMKLAELMVEFVCTWLGRSSSRLIICHQIHKHKVYFQTRLQSINTTGNSFWMLISFTHSENDPRRIEFKLLQQKLKTLQSLMAILTQSFPCLLFRSLLDKNKCWNCF